MPVYINCIAAQQLHFHFTELRDRDLDALQNQYWWQHENLELPLRQRMFFGDNVDMNQYEKLVHLHWRLLHIAGIETAFRLPEPNLDAILKNGKLELNAENTHLGEFAEESMCRAWLEERKTCRENKTELQKAPCSGYALRRDGIWIPYAWLLDISPGNTHVINTGSVEPLLYYGVQVSDESVRRMCRLLRIRFS